MTGAAASDCDDATTVSDGLAAGADGVTAGPAGAIAERQSSAGAAAGLSGGASDVLLALWRRVSIDALEVSGDRELAARFARATDLA